MKNVVTLAGKLDATINAGQSLRDAIRINNTYKSDVRLIGYTAYFKAGLGNAQATVRLENAKEVLTDEDTPICALGCQFDRTVGANPIVIPFSEILPQNKEISVELKAPVSAALNAEEVFFVFYAEFVK